MRKESIVTVTPEMGERFTRDFGKSFKITEMAAIQGEEWAMRALFAMGKANVDIPPEMLMLGWQAVAFAGLRALIAAPWPEAKPLLDEMMGCVQRQEAVAPRPLIDGDIEEIATRVWLRDEVFKLHANFSILDALLNVQSRLDQGARDRNQSNMPISPGSAD